MVSFPIRIELYHMHLHIFKIFLIERHADFPVALPHPEVPTAEFYKHISAQLTEPTRMRCLLGWCGSRALPPKPDAPKGSSKEANAEFQALQAGTPE